MPTESFLKKLMIQQNSKIIAILEGFKPFLWRVIVWTQLILFTKSVIMPNFSVVERLRLGNAISIYYTRDLAADSTFHWADEESGDNQCSRLNSQFPTFDPIISTMWYYKFQQFALIFHHSTVISWYVFSIFSIKKT